MEILKDMPEFKPFEVIVAEEVIDSYLLNGTGSGYNILVATEDTEITGYVCYGQTPMTDGTWDLYWEAVALEKQGRGIGTTLIREVETEVKKAGGRLVIIETSSTPGYEKTRRFYLKNGYSKVAQIPDFYSPGDDKLIFQKLVK
jgi:GNAT superfamily N-acetyltransferase